MAENFTTGQSFREDIRKRIYCTGLSAKNGKAGELPFFLNTRFFDKSRRAAAIHREELDLGSFMQHDPENSFMIRVKGNSMINAGIRSGDMLIVDRSIDDVNGKVVVAEINNALVVKRLRLINGKTLLISENEEFNDIKLTGGDILRIWGVVTSVIKEM